MPRAEQKVLKRFHLGKKASAKLQLKLGDIFRSVRRNPLRIVRCCGQARRRDKNKNALTQFVLLFKPQRPVPSIINSPRCMLPNPPVPICLPIRYFFPSNFKVIPTTPAGVSDGNNRSMVSNLHSPSSASQIKIKEERNADCIYILHRTPYRQCPPGLGPWSLAFASQLSAAWMLPRWYCRAQCPRQKIKTPVAL